MELRHFNISFFFLLLLIVGVGVVFLFLPFFTAMVVAAILAVLFQSTYQRLLRWLRGSVVASALITCLIVAVVIIAPIFTALSFAVNEANDLYHAAGSGQSLETSIRSFIGSVNRIPVIGPAFSPDIVNIDTFLADLREIGKNALGLLQAAYQGIASFLLWVFVMFFALYYFLIDGRRALDYLMRISPLRDEHDKLLMRKFVSISRATLKGTLLVGIVQGVLGGLMFWVTGVPSPLIWGMIMVLFSVIPMVGAGIVWVPAGVSMLLLGHVWEGIFILGVGAGVISTIDNVLRPKLVGKDTDMHPLLVFFATLGGLSLFGLSGFIIGPIIVALFMALSEIYMVEFHRQLKAYNEAKTGA